MVTRLQAKTESALTPLDYNERKRENGTAEIIYTNGVASTEPSEIRRVFREYEDNPAVSARARKMGIHITVNPGEKDNKREDAIVGYIREMMTSIGYGSQPYVVYRHHDIDRMHYHIVSVRARRNGKIIKDSFDKRRMMSIQKRLAKKYGFSAGLQKDFCEVSKLEARPMEKGMPHLVEQMRVNIDAVMHFLHDAEAEFRALLHYYGISMKTGKKAHHGKEYEYTSFRAVDENGNFISRPVQAKRLFGMSFKEYYRNNKRSKERNARVFSIDVKAAAIRNAFGASHDFADFGSRLSRRGIHIYPATESGNIASKVEDLHDILFIDTKNRIIFSGTDCGLKASQILALANKKKVSKQEEHHQDLKLAKRNQGIHR